MSSFVADENFDSKRLNAKCNAAGECTLRRCPPYLKRKKDPEILATLLSGVETLVTLDATIIEEHSQFVPDCNTGIIVIRLRRPSKTMTARLAEKILAQFKALMPSWSAVNWNGLYCEITESEVFISRLHKTEWVDRAGASYSSTTFDEDIKAAIRKYSPTSGLDVS